MSDYDFERTKAAIDSIRDQRGRNHVAQAVLSAHNEIHRLRERLARSGNTWGSFAKQVLTAVKQISTDPRMQWVAQLNVDTGEPEYTYACKECGAVRTFGSGLGHPQQAAEDLLSEFGRHRCLQHAIKCIRCATNLRLVIPHEIDDQMAERQMVLWTEECASRGASSENRPERLIGLGRIETKAAWVEMNADPATEYFSIFAAGREATRVANNGAVAPMPAQYARVSLVEAKQIRSRLDAWIFSREQLPSTPVECDRCAGVGRYVANLNNTRPNRSVDPCDKCNGHGRTKVDGTPLEGAAVPPQRRPRFGRGDGSGGSGRFA